MDSDHEEKMMDESLALLFKLAHNKAFVLSDFVCVCRELFLWVICCFLFVCVCRSGGSRQ